MAFTASLIVRGVVFGNQRLLVYNVTADATTGNVSTGLTKVNFSQVTSVSAPTNPVVVENLTPLATAVAGNLGFSNCTSGNVYRVVAYGY